MLSMRRGSAKKAKKRRRNATQKKNKQKLLAKFKQHFVVGPVLSVRGQPRTPWTLTSPHPFHSILPSLSLPFFCACAAYVPWDKQIRRWIARLPLCVFVCLSVSPTDSWGNLKWVFDKSWVYAAHFKPIHPPPHPLLPLLPSLSTRG